MSKYIDADELKQDIYTRSLFDDDVHIDLEFNEILEVIDNQPTADVEEVRHGEWIPIIQNYHWEDTGIVSTNIIGFCCSLCGAEEKFKHRYCHCGAKMDKEKE